MILLSFLCYSLLFLYDSRITRAFTETKSHKYIKKIINEDIIDTTIAFMGMLNIINPINKNSFKEISKKIFPFLLIYLIKTFFKCIKSPCNKRPLSSTYSTKKTWSGFPSGHIANITYLTYFFYVHNLKSLFYTGIILEILYSFLALSTGRHFASQLFAGFILGKTVSKL
jgi:membrane-associated phospholipid phosphatase